MLDQSNPDGAKQKKVKPPQNRPQKYWPESLSQISQVSGREDMDSEEDSMNSQSSGGKMDFFPLAISLSQGGNIGRDL